MQTLKDITVFQDLKDKRITKLLIILIFIDLLFVILHLLHAFRVFYFKDLSLEEDQGFPEIYQYIKEFLIAFLFVAILYKTKESGYSAWAFVFLFLLLDDALQIHEFLNDYIAEWFNLPSVFGLRPKDLGELLFAAVVGLALLFLMIISYKSGSTRFRLHSRNIFVLLLLLIFFGVVVDMFHIMIDLGHRVKQLLGTIEDGGEMIVMSLILGYVYLLKIKN